MFEDILNFSQCTNSVDLLYLYNNIDFKCILFKLQVCTHICIQDLRMKALGHPYTTSELNLHSAMGPHPSKSKLCRDFNLEPAMQIIQLILYRFKLNWALLY